MGVGFASFVGAGKPTPHSTYLGTRVFGGAGNSFRENGISLTLGEWRGKASVFYPESGGSTLVLIVLFSLTGGPINPVSPIDRELKHP